MAPRKKLTRTVLPSPISSPTECHSCSNKCQTHKMQSTHRGCTSIGLAAIRQITLGLVRGWIPCSIHTGAVEAKGGTFTGRYQAPKTIQPKGQDTRGLSARSRWNRLGRTSLGDVARQDSSSYRKGQGIDPTVPGRWCSVVGSTTHCGPTDESGCRWVPQRGILLKVSQQ